MLWGDVWVNISGSVWALGSVWNTWRCKESARGFLGLRQGETALAQLQTITRLLGPVCSTSILTLQSYQ
eukprot:5590931-Amphidinium_carterae.1